MAKVVDPASASSHSPAASPFGHDPNQQNPPPVIPRILRFFPVPSHTFSYFVPRLLLVLILRQHPSHTSRIQPKPTTANHDHKFSNHFSNSTPNRLFCSGRFCYHRSLHAQLLFVYIISLNPARTISKKGPPSEGASKQQSHTTNKPNNRDDVPRLWERHNHVFVL